MFKNFIFLFSLIILITGCNKSDSGGGTTASPTPPVSYTKCLDVKATNYNLYGTCNCPGGYLLNSSNNSCIVNPNGGGGLPSGNPPTNLSYPGGASVFSFLVNYDTSNSGSLLIPSVTNCSNNNCTFTTSFGANIDGNGITKIPGVFINKTTGKIFGLTPSSPISQSFIVTATNSDGSTSVGITINVLQRAPSGLTISNPDATYKVGDPITSNNISIGSGLDSVSSMIISPALPSGLTLQKFISGWAIAGTPSVSSSKTLYTITACGPTNPCATLNLSITTQSPPSLSFSYNISNNPLCTLASDSVPECTFNLKQSFSDILANVTGDNLQFEILSGGLGMIPSNEFPSGIALSSTTGKIYTTSYGAFESTAGQMFNYVIRAFNNVGSVQTSIRIKVNGEAPATGFNYAGSPYLFRVITPISDLNPIFVNGQYPTCFNMSGCFSISPTLPSGLGFSDLSGVIYGSPDRISINPETIYTITANQADSPITTQIRIEIKEKLPIFAYNQGANYTYTKGVDLTAVGVPAINSAGTLDVCSDNTNNRMPITSFSVSPALPAGLSLNAGSFTCGISPDMNGGSITGIPSAYSPSTEYSITGCNSGGCSVTKIKIEIPMNITKLVAGANHACALVKDDTNPGKVQCWGSNEFGQLGYTGVDSCSNINGNYNCNKAGKYVKTSGGTDLTNVIDIAAGKNFTCAILDLNPADDATNGGLYGGPIYCWGQNNFGQLGQGSFANSLSPVQIKFNNDSLVSKATKLGAGVNSVCFTGEETINYTDANNNPASKTITAAVYCLGENYGNKAIRIGGGNTVTNNLYAIEVSVGDQHACAVSVTVDAEGNFEQSNVGTVKCFGKNNLAQLGIGNSSSDPFSLSPSIAKINAATVVSGGGLVSGLNHSCIKTNFSSAGSNAVCWGDNSLGQLGNNSTSLGIYASNILNINGSAPLSYIANLGVTSNGTSIVANESASDTTSKLFNIGSLNVSGIPYSSGSSSLPIKIKSAVDGIFYDFLSSNYQPLISASASNFNCARENKGSIKCWGNNDSGQLGNSDGSSVIPVNVRLNY